MALFRAAALPAAAAISAALGLAVVPAAHAAAPAAGPAATVKVGVAAPSSLYLLPQGADEPAVAAQYRTFSVGYYVADEASPTGVTITGNASALVGKADLQLPSACSWTSSAHTGFSCDAGRIEFAGELDFRVRSAVGAAEGATGALTFAVHGKNISADGGKDSPANYRTVFTVGHGPDLAVNQAMGDSGFSLYGSGAPLVIASKAGVQAPVRITNKGDRDASDIYVVVGASGLEDEQGVRLASTWSNCLYDPMDPSDALCHFPNAVIHPGETYQLSPRSPSPATRRPPAASSTTPPTWPAAN
ncbi:hypothetical protein ACFQZC_21380 [Streptacidiphilus monticola]